MSPYKKLPAVFFAGFWVRLFAYAIDGIVLWGIKRIFLNPLSSLLFFPVDKHFPSVYSVLALVVTLAYFVLMTLYCDGQTLGKMIMGVRVVSLKDEKLDWKDVLVREGAMRAVQILIWPLYLMIPFTDRHRSLADLFADTGVVRERMFLAEPYFKRKFAEEERMSEPNVMTEGSVAGTTEV